MADLTAAEETELRSDVERLDKLLRGRLASLSVRELQPPLLEAVNNSVLAAQKIATQLLDHQSFLRMSALDERTIVDILYRAASDMPTEGDQTHVAWGIYNLANACLRVMSESFATVQGNLTPIHAEIQDLAAGAAERTNPLAHQDLSEDQGTTRTLLRLLTEEMMSIDRVARRHGISRQIRDEFAATYRNIVIPTVEQQLRVDQTRGIRLRVRTENLLRSLTEEPDGPSAEAFAGVMASTSELLNEFRDFSLTQTDLRVANAATSLDLNAAKLRAGAASNEIRNLQTESSRVVEDIKIAAGTGGEVTLYEHFHSYAKAERWRAFWAMVIMFFFVAVGVGIPAGFLLNTDDLQWSAEIAVKLATGLPFFLLAAFFARRAAIFTETSRRAKEVEVRLRTIRAFTDDGLSDDDTAMVRRNFGLSLFSLASLDEKTVSEGQISTAQLGPSCN